MSYILEALKRSEQKRLRGRKAPLFAPERAVPQVPRFVSRPLALAAALASVAGAGALLAFFLGDNASETPANQANASPEQAVVAPAPVALPPAPLVPNTPSKNRDLAESVGTSANTGRATKPATAPAPSAVAASSQTAKGTKASLNRAPTHADVPFLRAMPLEFQQALPELNVNIHVYAPNEPDRILYINNRPFRKGEQIQTGIVVEEIVPDGVVIKANGQRFKLPRPS
jgi:general secretion pathway protein B